MMKRLSILSALMVLATMGLASAAQAKPFTGVADQSVNTLNDPRFKKSGIKRYRIAVSYDQIRKGLAGKPGSYARQLLNRQDEFFRLAKQQRLDVMVSFYRTSMLSPKRAAASLPSVSQFRKDFRDFRKRYPQIKKFSTWNEINFKIAQPTGRNPKRAGQFYKMLRKECRWRRRQVLRPDRRLPPGRQQARRALAEDVPEGDRQGPAPVGPDSRTWTRTSSRPSSRSGSSRTPSAATCT